MRLTGGARPVVPLRSGGAGPDGGITVTTLQDVLSDLADEQESLDAVVADLAPEQWEAPTPAKGWAVRDQIWHLAFFDEAARQAVSEPAAFVAGLAQVAEDPGGFERAAVEAGRRRPPAAVLATWRANRQAFQEAVSRQDPSTRAPWYGLQMSVMSMVTARLMETWTHGQDVVDGLGQVRQATDRLRHVAFIGCRSLPFAFQVRGRQPPAEPVRVELTLPSGAPFFYGPQGAADLVRGTALDFCLVATQRRHLDDVDLEIVGPVAAAWMPIAQAFAGPPGPGRRPGEYASARGRPT
jgi:uncharacterized protein (TIGR03084 family)